MKWVFRTLLFLLAFVSLPGCEERQTSGLSWTDSSGVRILEIPVDLQIPHTDLSEESVRIVTGRDDDPIGGVRGLIWLDSARIALADDDMTVRVYDRNGQRLGIPGKAGQGPGEFKDILWLDHGGNGAFAAFDPMLNRLSIFDSTLTFDRTVIPVANPGILVHWAGFLPDEAGMAGVGLISEPSPGRVEPPSLWGYTTVFTYSGLRNEVDTITRFAWNRCKDEVTTRCAPDGWAGAINPEGDRIYLTPLDWPEIREYSSGGALLRIIRHADPTGDGFPQLILDDQGRPWTSRESEESWTVYDPAARNIRRYTFPDRFRLRDVWGSSALGVFIDSLNVSYVATLEMSSEGAP